MSLLGPNRGAERQTIRPAIGPSALSTRSSTAKADLRAKRFPSPFRQHDGTLYPRIFRKYTQAPSEITMPAPLSPMFTIVSSPRNAFLDTHVMAVVTVRRAIEERPGEFFSAVGAVFAPNSKHNHSSVVCDHQSMPAFQLRAMVDAISAAYSASDALKKAGCHRLVITLDREMEWIAHVVCRWQDLLDRAMDDEILLYNYFRYPDLMNKLIEFLETFEAVTKIRIQFWPTENNELSGAYNWVNKAVDHYVANHQHYGVFGDSDEEDYEDEDSDENYSEEEDVGIRMADEEARAGPAPGLISDTDDKLAAIFRAAGIEDISEDDETEPATPPSGSFTEEEDPDRAPMPFEKLFKAAGIDCAMIAAADTGPRTCGAILAKLAFGADTYEELLQTPIFREAAAAVAANPTQDEASRFVSGLL